jgi:hypothetical protein
LFALGNLWMARRQGAQDERIRDARMGLARRIKRPRGAALGPPNEPARMLAHIDVDRFTQRRLRLLFCRPSLTVDMSGGF